MKLFNAKKKVAVLALVSFLGACTEKQVLLPDDYFSSPKKEKVVVTHQPAMKDSVYLTGVQGALEVAINLSANDSLKKSIEKEDNEKWMNKVSQDFSTALNKHHIKAHVVKDIYQKDASGKQVAINASQLLTLELKEAGEKRAYYSMLPLSNPRAYYKLQGELKDLDSKNVLWRKTVVVDVDAGKNWDKKPDYPEFKKALYQAQKEASSQLISSFFQRV